MKHFVLSLVVAFFTLGLVIPEAEARRFGGGGNFGMQRQMTPQQAPRQPVQQQANRQPTQQPATAQGRSWMGPIAGLAAGLGLAALFTHLGLGEELGSLLLIGLLIFAAVMLFRMLSRRAAMAAGQGSNPMQFAAGSASASQFQSSPTAFTPGSNSYQGGSGSGQSDFDIEAFVRQAKVQFIRLQAAHDEGNLADIRNFTTPEVFAEIRMQMADAPTGAPQRTDIVELEANVIEVVEEDDRYIVSVRFHGLLREEDDTPPAAFDEAWHLTKDKIGDRGWVIAGIQQIS